MERKGKIDVGQPEPLKDYEREILRARSRVQVADLDNEIDDLIKVIIGKLTKVEHKRYQVAELDEVYTFVGDKKTASIS